MRPALVHSAITVRGLRKSYDGFEAVRGIDFDVAKGEVFGFLGPNGAGKTTTIEILEGYRQRTGGEVAVLGVDPGTAPRAWRERIGLVLQECHLTPTLTVRETVGLFASFFSHPRSCDEVIEVVGLSERRDSRVGALSGGQQRRLDVALGLVGDPELIFLDEPTTGFDPSARRDSWRMIEELRELGKTVFLTTHYMDEAQALADRVAILRGGLIVAQGPPRQLAAELGREAVIRFRKPARLSEDALREAIDGAALVDRQDGELTVRTSDTQRVLYRLLKLADDRGIELEGLEVRHPTLEEVFLELTAEEPAA